MLTSKIFMEAGYLGRGFLSAFLCLFFLKMLFIFRERGGEGEREGRETSIFEREISQLACNPGMCPDWESNQRPFGS